MTPDKDKCVFPAEKQIFRGTRQPDPSACQRLPSQPPPWRKAGSASGKHRGMTYQASPREIDMVNAALYLRRPLLITGPPGVGKSSLAHAVAYELGLDDVLMWPITSRSTRAHGLYSYDAVARFQDIALAVKQQEARGQGLDTAMPSPTTVDVGNRLAETELLHDIGHYITLGPLGTAFLRSQADRPSVVLIDELDKSDIDLPNDLLHLFEEGAFEIAEIARLPESQCPQGVVRVKPHGGGTPLPVNKNGLVQCKAFPLVIITSNGEREFPPAFLRRCLRLEIPKPNEEKLRRIVKEHLSLEIPKQVKGANHSDRQALGVLEQFLKLRDGDNKEVATDQLLNALYLVKQEIPLSDTEAKRLREDILAALAEN